MDSHGTWLDFLREWSGWFCHKIPERSPHSGVDLFPVCFRCAGWQFGLFASYVRMMFGSHWRGRFPSIRVTLACVALMTPLLIDGLGNTFHIWNSPGWFRALTGLGVGLSLPWLLAPLAYSVDLVERASLETLRPFFWPALTGVVAVVLLDSVLEPTAFLALAIVTAAGWYIFVAHFLFALVRSYEKPLVHAFNQLFRVPETNT